MASTSLSERDSGRLSRRLRGLAAARSRPTRHQLVIAVVLGAALAFYMWTAASSTPFVFGHHDSDVYNELTTGFLHGHTYLAVPAPAGLTHLKNPYDPAQNAAYSNNGLYHDLSLYKGRFYSQWGPTPVLTLFAPFRITGFEMSTSFAVALYAFLGLVFAVLLLHTIVDHLVPNTPRWLLTVATIGLAFSNVAPFLLRRPAQYEVAISCGYCFEMAGLWLVLSAAFSKPTRRRRLALGSLCLGLAIGGRPTLALGGFVVLAIGIHAIRRRGESRTILLSALGPFVACGLLLAMYNAVRFGSFTEFGQTWELAGVNQSVEHFYRLAYVPPGLFSYLFLLPRYALTFPHVFLMTASAYPGTLPAGYGGAPGSFAGEPVGGVLAMSPITILLLILPLLWRDLRGKDQRALTVAAGLTGLGFAIALLISWALYGTTQRYEVDFASLLLIAAFVIWAVLLDAERGRRGRRRVIAAVGILLTAFGAATGVAVSFTGYYDTLRLEHPGTFNTLEDITSPFATLATMIVGRAAIARVDAGAVPVSLPQIRYRTFDMGDASTYLGTTPVDVVVDSPDDENSNLTAGVGPVPGAPAPASLQLRVQSPDRRPITVPLKGPNVRFPIHLNWGLNRIKLSLVGTPTAAEEVALNGINLAPSRH